MIEPWKMDGVFDYVHKGAGGYWGWHDDHAAFDGTDRYRPAIQQARNEFIELATILPIGGRCLQLGMGPSGLSHGMWQLMFKDVLTIDLGQCWLNYVLGHSGLNTHDRLAVSMAI